MNNLGRPQNVKHVSEHNSGLSATPSGGCEKPKPETYRPTAVKGRDLSSPEVVGFERGLRPHGLQRQPVKDGLGDR